MYGMSVNAAPCVSVILTMREMSVILTQIDLLSVKLTHSPIFIVSVFNAIQLSACIATLKRLTNTQLKAHLRYTH